MIQETTAMTHPIVPKHLGYHSNYYKHVSPPQRMVGKYVLSKTIGKGSTGKVKLAINTETHEKVAIKIVSRRSQSDNTHAEESAKTQKKTSREERTIREANIMVLLDHPYIARAEEMLLIDNHYYLFMEYVNGGQLLDYIIARGKLKERQARQFSRQIASALDYCHRNSIVHRDLKVENILISRSGNVKIIDFGLSNMFEPRSQLSTFCGSLYFAAPELLGGKLYTGPEVDVWSFGVTLYVLLCGKVPFDDPTMAGLHAKVKRGIVEYPSHISADVKNLLQSMLLVDPKQRATMSEVIAHPWINKGYDKPIENHLPKRKPLQFPIDMEVVHGMQGFEFGCEESIKETLENLISSEEYQRDAKAVELKSSQSSKQKTTNMPADGFLRRKRFRNVMDDPQFMPSAQHPLISIYHLVKERMERDKDYKAKLSFNNVLEKEPHANHTVSHVEHRQKKREGHLSTEVHSLTGQELTASVGLYSRLPSKSGNHHHHCQEKNNSIAGSKESSHTHHMSSNKPSNVFARLSRRLSKQSSNGDDESMATHKSTPVTDSPRGYREDEVMTHSQLKDGIPTVTLSKSPVDPNCSQGHDSNGNTRTNAALSNTLDIFLKRAKSITVKDLPSTQNNRNREKKKNANKLYRKSMFDPVTTADDMHRNNKSSSNEKCSSYLAHQSNSTVSRQAESIAPEKNLFTPVQADQSIQPVYLRGIFSVSTTSTKKACAIRQEILSVLDALSNIEYRERKDRFECISIKKRNGESSAGSQQLHTQTNFLECSDDEETLSPHDRQTEISVQFDIYIVKIPWLLGIRGVQFRRILGDPWEYKNTCSTILDNLKL